MTQGRRSVFDVISNSATGQLRATRRQILGGLASISATGLSASEAIADPTPPAPVKDWLLGPGMKPFDIPLDFLGLHSSHGVSGKTPAPTYNYDAIRSHDLNNGNDQPASQWADIEVQPGVYNWRHIDAWMATHVSKTRIWVLFGTPKFYQKYPNEPFPFHQLPGRGSPPRDPAKAAEFVAVLLARYPGKFQFIEIWNEPNFGSGTNPLIDRYTPPAVGDPAWFSGTAHDLATMARLVRGVLPPDVKLMAAGWAWQAKNEDVNRPSNSVLRFAAAPDGAGGFGRDHVQALSIHLYTYHLDPNATINEVRNYNKLFVKAGYPATLERHVTETGAWAPQKFTATTPSMADKARIVKRWCMIPPAMGYRSVYLYAHSVLGTLGDPARAPEISAAIGEMRDGLRGKRLLRAAVLADDTIWMSFADGTMLRA